MRCPEARRALSAALDDELATARVAVVDRHVETCSACTRYRAGLHRLRASLRVEPVEHVVDLVPRVDAELDAGPEPVRRREPATRRTLSLAAAFLAAVLAGATFVGFVEGPERSAARDLSGAVLRAQRTVGSLHARVVVTEHNWHPDVPERRFAGSLDYRAPESLALHLADETPYPSPEWVRGAVDVVVAENVAWTRAVVPCPRETLPECTPAALRTRAVVGREPFPDREAAPLDLVVPVGSFAASDAVEDLGRQRVEGRRAIGVRVTVAQVAPLLDGLRAVGNWRALHSTDTVDLWLDEAALVPLALDVRPAASEARADWAAGRGYADDDGIILSIRFRDVAIDGPVATSAFAPVPGDAIVRDAGFVDEPTRAPSGPIPAWLPPGMRLVRAGAVQVASGPPASVRAWSDGRAWVKVATTDAWPGGQLFGQLGSVVRTIDLGTHGVAYVDERGTRVGVHTDDLDIAVSGSVATADLVAVARSLEISGQPVPADWAEGGTVAIDRPAVDGFGEPACQERGATSTCAYAGPGTRGFRMVEAPGNQLTPPIDVDAQAVEVDGLVGRWSPSIGVLEWVDGDVVVSLSSQTLSVGELVGIAEVMRS